jgi:hypothetical protein
VGFKRRTKGKKRSKGARYEMTPDGMGKRRISKKGLVTPSTRKEGMKVCNGEGVREEAEDEDGS